MWPSAIGSSSCSVVGGWTSTRPCMSLVAAGRGTPLLMLALGYPVSQHQQAFITRAIDEAFEARVHLDARIVGRLDELASHVGAADDVTIVAAGRDERRIGSVLARLPS